MSMIVNQSELARVFGVSTSTVKAWRSQGLPQEESEGRAHQYDTAKVIEWYLDYKRPENDVAMSKDYYDMLYRKHKAKSMELKYLREAGKTVSVSDCAENMASRLMNIADQLKTIPLNWAPYLVGIDSQAESQKTLQSLLSDLLSILQNLPNPELAGSAIEIEEDDERDD